MVFRPALLVILGLASAVPVQPATAQDTPQARIDTAVARGLAHLSDLVAERTGRRRRGGVDVVFGERPGVLALVAYAQQVAGVEREDPDLRRLLGSLAFLDLRTTYDVACTLFAVVEHDPLGHRRWVAELADRLAGWQHDGMWGYPEGGDLSNTQYAALGLWAATRAGVDVPVAVWEALADTLPTYQVKGGGFVYRPGGGGPTGSMTAAGVGTLALCERVLARRGALTEARALELRGARERGLDWLEVNFRADRNPGGDAWTHYWLYGVERLGALTGLALIGSHDWYAEGAAWLLEQQRKDGSWSGWDDQVTTAFALLFLCRATAVHAPRTGPDARSSAADLEAVLHLTSAAAPDGALTFRLTGFHRPTVAALCWPGEGTSPRVLRVEYLVDGQVVATALGDGRQPPRGNVFAAVARGLAPGRHTFRARAFVRPPPDATGAERSIALESAPTWIEVEDAVPAWRRGDPRGPASAVSGARIEAHASTTLAGLDELPEARFRPENAVDGKHRRPWLAREQDREPQLRLSFRDGVRADRVRLVPPRLAGFASDALGRPLQVRLEIDGSEWLVAMPPDPEQVVEVVLDEPRRVRRLEVRILASVPGTLTRATGLGEIELGLEE